MKENLTENNMTEWDLSLSKTSIIANYISTASESYVNGYFEKSFRHWKQIRLLIGNRLSEAEIKKCKLYENSIPNYIIFKKVDYCLPQKLYSQKYLRMLERYIEIINQMLRKSGLDIKEKSQSGLF